MFWRSKGKSTRKPRKSRGHSLRMEPLESRTVLTGIVNIEIAPMNAPGFLDLIGDASNNEIEIRHTGTPGTYEIQGVSGTLLQINGAGVTVPSVTVNGITDDIFIALMGGNDRLSFEGGVGGNPSNIPADLLISNGDGSNVNVLDDVLINGDLLVDKGGASSYAELHILNSRIIGDAIIDNLGGGSGDSMTVIDTSHLQGGGTGEDALVITNGIGQDTLDVRGDSQFGTGPFVGGQPIISIDNSDGGSRTTFTGSSMVAGPGSTTVYGDIDISNGDNLPGQLDILTLNNINVLGNFDLANGSGGTTSVVTSSTLGSHLTTGGPGGPATISNDDGFDSLTISDSIVPWGLYVDNDDADGGGSNWGSSTEISDSELGTRMLGIPDDAFELLGDNGADSINVSNSTFGGMLDLTALGNGLNSFSFTNGSSTPYLAFVGGDSNDSVEINDSAVTIEVLISLGSGADTLLITDVDPATQWPSPLLGMITLDGGIGVDSTNIDAITLGALDFELIV